ncbi:MAG: LysR family transcriptional regulator [Rhodospirillaceae bacterium]|nr:LysR family transcriptional regulator [Rhodospirillaceae bacterium]
MALSPAALRRLDLTQLDYLRHVAREGGVIAAAAALNVAPQTVSGQLRVLEKHLGQKLLQRVGRGVQLTDAGRLVLEYGADMLTRGEELMRALETPELHRPSRFVVGIGELVPKLVARQLLHPVLRLSPTPQLVCRERADDALLQDLEARRVDAVIVSIATSPGSGLESTLLAESAVGAFGIPRLAQRYALGFPASLNGAPLLFPAPGTEARSLVDGWLAARNIAPHIAGEFDNAASREVFGAAGVGLFLAPQMIEADLKSLYGVEKVGVFKDLIARYFLIAPLRTRRSVAEEAIRNGARKAKKK